jgi:phosphoglycolate phosphatase
MIRAVIFDKDGTLFDFRKSWGAWCDAVLAHLAADPATRNRLSGVLGYDPEAGDFVPASPVIASTTPQVIALVHEALPGSDLAALDRLMNDLAVQIPMIPAVDLPQVLGDLKQRGLVLGLATNDTEAPAREHLDKAGVLDLFDFVAGCDSGWGGKPAPGQLTAFARLHGLDPTEVAMVGDSTHDLHAGRAAGMKSVAVLTGIAKAEALAPHADVVLPSIAGLGRWIDSIT